MNIIKMDNIKKDGEYGEIYKIHSIFGDCWAYSGAGAEDPYEKRPRTGRGRDHDLFQQLC